MNTSFTKSFQDNRTAWIGMALALLAALFFSIKAIFVKLAYQYGVDAITLLTLRMAFALPIFIVVAVIEQRKSGVPVFAPDKERNMNTSFTKSFQDNRTAWIGMALALLAALFFSIKAIFVKLAYQYGVDAITLLTLRMAFALPIFIVVAVIEQRKSSAQKITLHQCMSIIGLGLVFMFLSLSGANTTPGR